MIPSNCRRQGGGFFTGAKPDIMLTEIHRQTRDNPIIRMSMDIREGRPLRYGEYGGSRIVGSWQEMRESRALSTNTSSAATPPACTSTGRCARTGWPARCPATGWCACATTTRKGLLNGEQFMLNRVDKISKDGSMALYVKSDDRSELDYVVTHRQFFECTEVEEAHARVGRMESTSFATGMR